jgi:hypothetical protein
VYQRFWLNLGKRSNIIFCHIKSNSKLSHILKLTWALYKTPTVNLNLSKSLIHTLQVEVKKRSLAELGNLSLSEILFCLKKIFFFSFLIFLTLFCCRHFLEWCQDEDDGQADFMPVIFNLISADPFQLNLATLRSKRVFAKLNF